MAFFEDLGKKISDTGESMKLSSLLAEEEKKVTTLYTQIGKMYVERHEADCEEVFVNIVKEISATNQKIAELNQQINRLKGYVPCPNCAVMVPFDAPFCSNCGNRMAVTPVPEKEPVKYCKNCNAVLKSDAAFCTSCGSKAEAAECCKNCGAILKEGSAFCTKCGTKAEPEVATAQAQQETQPEAQPEAETPSIPVCKNCGKELNESAKFCTGCGTKAE